MNGKKLEINGFVLYLSDLDMPLAICLGSCLRSVVSGFTYSSRTR